MADYRCYQGRCRLASNPESPTCEEAAIIPQVTKVIEKKGISPEDDSASVKESSPSTTPQPTVELATSSGEIEELKLDAETRTVPSENDEKEISEKNSLSIFSNLSTALNNFFNSFNWQYLALAGLLIIIAVVFIILGLIQDPQRASKKKKDQAGLSKKRQAEIEQKIQQQEVTIPENKKLDL
jgi:hypothetical protein